MEDCIKNAQALSDGDLIVGCQRGDAGAWRQFFMRFNEAIDRQILRTFRLIQLDFREDDFDSAKNAVIDTLIDPDKLAAVTDPQRFKAWLFQVCRSKARDVARTRRSIRNSANSAAQRATVSLHQPAGMCDASQTLESCIASSAPPIDHDTQDIFAKVQTAIDALEWIYQGPIKISLLFYADFLQPADLQRIAAERAICLESLQAELNTLLDDLLHKHAGMIKHEASIRVSAAYVERLKSRCHTFACHPELHRDLEVAQRELAQHEQRLTALLSGRNRPVIPSTSQIASILAQKENVIATRLFRARKLLAKKLQNQDVML